MAHTRSLDGTGFRRDVRGLGQDVEYLKADVANLGRGAMEAARSGASQVRRGAHQATEAAKDGAFEAVKSLRGAVGRNPVASIGIAAGVGILIGLAIFRPGAAAGPTARRRLSD